LILPVVAPFILHIFNTTLTSGIFPLQWKRAKITPIPKIDRPSLDDFRPISILPFLAKSLENIMNDQMINFIESKKLLYNYI